MGRKQISIRVDEKIEEELRRIAEAEHRSLNKQIGKALEEWLISTYQWKPPLEEAIEEVESGNIESAYREEQESDF